MTKHLRFLFVMLLAMIWSAGWAQEVTMNFTDNTSWNFPTDSKNTKSGTYGKGNSAVSLTGGNYYFTNNKCLMLKENGTLTFTAFDFEVEKIVVKGNTGGSKNTKQNIYVNDKAVSSETTSSKVTNTYIINDKYQSVGTIYVLKVSNANAQINEILIYKKESSSSTKTDTKVSFSENSGKTFTFTEGKYSDGTFTTPTATETTGVAGTIAYSSSNATAISVDASTGALTFKGYGKATITATFTPNDTEKYVESTDSYIVENNQKVDESVILFSADAESFESIKGTAYDKNIGDFVFVATNGKNYTFNVQRALTDNGRLQLNGSTVTSPSFPDFTNGYKVSVEYTANSKSAEFTLSSGSKSVSGQGQCDKKTLLLDVKDGAAFIITNNKAAYVSKIEIVPNKVGIILDENSESNTIEAKTGVNVTLKRSMVANEWNTICLPFDVTMDKAKAAFGDNVKIVELDTEAAVDANVLSFKASTGIVAATPYLIKPSAVSETGTYTFKGVEIKEAAVTPRKVKTNGNLYFNGIYNKMDVTTDVSSGYYAAFLGANNTIFKAKAGGTMKGFRAYFAIPKSASASALRVVIDGTATSIKNIDSEVVESNAPVYNLQGQRVDGNNLTPGIYVKAGKKFVVK